MRFTEFLIEQQDEDKLKHLEHVEDHVIHGGKKGFDSKRLRQTGLIAFRRGHLSQFNDLEPTYLEKAESVDMMRFLEHGVKIKMIYTAFPCPSVDTVNDRDSVNLIMKKDKLFDTYKVEELL